MPTFDEWPRITFVVMGLNVSDRNVKSIYTAWPKIGEPILLRAMPRQIAQQIIFPLTWGVEEVFSNLY